MATTTTLSARFTPPPPSIPSNNPSQSRNIFTSEAANLSAKHMPPIHLTKTLDNRRDTGPAEKRHKKVMIDDEEIYPVGVADFIGRSKEIMGVGFGKDVSGPPRWFTPLDCDGEGRIDGAPVLLYLPGIDGSGFGLIRHHQKLKKIFDIWCLHIPVMDRTPFEGLVQYVERTLWSETARLKNKPIYIVGESLGACIAFAVVARNPDIDLMIISANSATSFNKSQLQTFLSIANTVPEPFYSAMPNALKITDISLKNIMSYIEKDLTQSFTVIPESAVTMLSYLSFLAEILPKESLIWKLKMLKSSSLYANSRLHAVRAQMLILASGKDPLFPNEEEAERIRNVNSNCRIRLYKDSYHTVFLERSFDLVTVIKGTSFYRRSERMNYAVDYLLPTSTEIQKIVEEAKLFKTVVSSVTLSTLENGKVVRGLGGIPTEGPAIFVGYHMMMGAELFPMVAELLTKKNILLRGLAHPFLFNKESEKALLDTSWFDTMRIMGATPVSAMNFYNLLAEKQFVLLYPGGVREALHKKGEEYHLFWPEQSEFIRMASKFGATIVPFGVVGEDDLFELALDSDDLANVPFHNDLVERINKDAVRLRTDSSGELKNQHLHLPLVLPKVPGRFYYLFGKPIETKGRGAELEDKKRAGELYLNVKSEVEGCIAYLKEKREKDPYRNILSRLIYQTTHGFESEVPTFEL